MEIIDVNAKTGFSETFIPRILRVKPEYKIPLICMEPGQQIAPHPGGVGIFYVLSGKAVMTVEGKDYEATAGMMLIVDKGETRGIRAIERFVAFAVHMTA
ncbi:MAG: cupin domain-containing protein [Deltaproteobacteria bacterium]|nr:cupin domain-containing protein [Deltaproteobacteria bacterium]